MLLSRDQILKHRKNGTIVIEPFSECNLKTTNCDSFPERNMADKITVDKS